ncbi:MAG: class I SAM-dependent methyltransferase [Leptolyngbya sp. SIO3F4]|nr:class I SAM-dependent methyltransferase [Leptolyngbya sp. SIO3F4]
MDFNLSSVLGKQLSEPSGFFGRIIARFMHDSNAPMYESALNSLKIKPGDRVLEIGFGNGTHFKNIIHELNPKTYSGIEISDAMLKAARKKNKPLIEQGKIKLFKASIENLPFEAHSFDKVYTVNTIYFWRSPEKAVSEVFRTLSDNGLFTVSLNSKSLLETKKFAANRFTLYSKEEVIHLLEFAGFTHIKENYQQFKHQDCLTITGKKSI